MDSKTNAVCDICGREYKVCRTCQGIQSFKPWRTVVDTLDHYRIYLVLSEYTNTHDKEKAKHDLEYCDLSDIDSFTNRTRKVIAEILEDTTAPSITVQKAKTIRKRSSVKSKSQWKDVVSNNNEKVD